MMSMAKTALPFLGLLAAAALLAGGVFVLTRGGDTLSAPTEVSPTDDATRSIPPIDAAAPAKVETATFALG
jgi:hypothetical protein